MASKNTILIARLASELQALTEIAKALSSPVELPELLDTVMKTIISVLQQADNGAIMLWEQASGLFRPAASFGYQRETLKEIGLRAGESITGKVYNGQQACLFNTIEEVAQAMADMRSYNRQIMAQAAGTNNIPQCAIAAPITAGDEKFGVLVLETLHGQQKFTQADLPFVQTLADFIAQAIDRARLEARADAVRETQRAEWMRSEIMATLSHELRMPLSTIKGYASALLLDELNWSFEKRTEFLHLIEDACDDMEGMIKDILDSSLIEVERLGIEPQPLRLPIIARELATEIQNRSKIHTLVVDFPPDFPIVEADLCWIKQVFRNIIDNAVKYSPEGGLIVIKGESRPSDVVVSLADQGIGISPENLVPLFEKYFRVRSTTSLHVPGTGLGLPIARAIVEAHGGKIWMESKFGEGSTVFFSLPRSQISPVSTASRLDFQSKIG
jgi:K+-sensing histidine kinase KdpD